MKPGDQIRTTADELGALDPDANGRGFLPDVVIPRGSVGVVHVELPISREGQEQWYLAIISHDGVDREVPVARSMVEVIT